MYHILILLPISTLFLAPVAFAATPTTNPSATTYAWIPGPATLLSEIPGSGKCDRDIEMCMRSKMGLTEKRQMQQCKLWVCAFHDTCPGIRYCDVEYNL